MIFNEKRGTKNGEERETQIQTPWKRQEEERIFEWRRRTRQSQESERLRREGIQIEKEITAEQRESGQEVERSQSKTQYLQQS